MSQDMADLIKSKESPAGSGLYLFSSQGHNHVLLSRFKTGNLFLLMNYLLSGNLKARFDIRHWSADILSIQGTDCGSVGCAVGHGPYAGVGKHKDEKWPDYAKRCFVLNDQYLSIDSLFRYLFSDSWASTDNTPEGAGLRIKYFFMHGIPPDIEQDYPNYEKLLKQYEKLK